MGVNRGGFGDEQCTRSTSPLSVIFETKVTMDVLFVRSKPCHWTEDDTMLEVHAADANRLKKFGRGHLDESDGYRRSVGARRLDRNWVRTLRGPHLRVFIRTEFEHGFDLHSSQETLERRLKCDRIGETSPPPDHYPKWKKSDGEHRRPNDKPPPYVRFETV